MKGRDKPMCSRPIMRGDGVKYRSANEAALHIAKETGTGRLRAMVPNIVNVANGKKHCNTAYGYRWEWVS